MTPTLKTLNPKQYSLFLSWTRRVDCVETNGANNNWKQVQWEHSCPNLWLGCLSCVGRAQRGSFVKPHLGLFYPSHPTLTESLLMTHLEMRFGNTYDFTRGYDSCKLNHDSLPIFTRRLAWLKIIDWLCLNKDDLEI